MAKKKQKNSMDGKVSRLCSATQKWKVWDMFFFFFFFFFFGVIDLDGHKHI